MPPHTDTIHSGIINCCVGVDCRGQRRTWYCNFNSDLYKHKHYSM